MSAPAPIRLLIHGGTGRMGRALLRLAAADPRFTLAATVNRTGDGVDGVRALASDRLDEAPDFKVLVDFSLPAAFDAALAFCTRRRCAFVSGTTGLSDAQRAAMESAATQIPVLWSANFSVGVVVLTELVRRVAAIVPDWDCDIVETHHRDKRDAPSGTALALGATIAESRGAPPHYESLRVGEVVGEHAVQFAGIGERLELIHRASDRDIFARGALEAATRIAHRPAGQYRLSELLMGA